MLEQANTTHKPNAISDPPRSKHRKQLHIQAPPPCSSLKCPPQLDVALLLEKAASDSTNCRQIPCAAHTTLNFLPARRCRFRCWPNRQVERLIKYRRHAAGQELHQDHVLALLSCSVTLEIQGTLFWGNLFLVGQPPKKKGKKGATEQLSLELHTIAFGVCFKAKEPFMFEANVRNRSQTSPPHLAISCGPSSPRKWLWVKHRYPKWNPGKWKHGPKSAVPCWFYFDPYPTNITENGT